MWQLIRWTVEYRRFGLRWRHAYRAARVRAACVAQHRN
jgi:hypothetical protein